MEMRFPIILDGATGTQLQKRGFTGDMSAEQWVLEHPEILEVQRAYVAAGSKSCTPPLSAQTARSLRTGRFSTARRR
ncbi:MAG: homocysteine S-methyltransferase family protein [Oscillospiraceae bacterium]